MLGISVQLFNGMLRKVLGEGVGALAWAEHSIELLRVMYLEAHGADGSSPNHRSHAIA